MSYEELKNVIGDMYEMFQTFSNFLFFENMRDGIVVDLLDPENKGELESKLEGARLRLVSKGYLKSRVFEDGGKKVEKFNYTERSLRILAFLESIDKLMYLASGVKLGRDKLMLVMYEWYKREGAPNTEKIAKSLSGNEVFRRIYMESLEKKG